MRTVELQDRSIMLLGKFNPSIFQPSWFALQHLIGEREAEKAKIVLIHNDVVSFELDWLTVLVTRTNCTFVSTQEPYFEALRDIAAGTFEILKHTPLTHVGLNQRVHCKFDTVEKWHELGHKLAPKELWSDILSEPGMRSLTMLQNKRSDKYKGSISVIVEPSLRINPGVFVAVNDHYDGNTDEKIQDSSEIVSIIVDNWHSSNENAKKIIDRIINFDK